LNEKEVFWISKLDTFKNGYNATIGGDGKQYLDYGPLVEAYDKYGTLSAAARFANVDPGSVRKALLFAGRSLPSANEVAKKSLGKRTVMMDTDDSVLQTFTCLRDAGRFLVDVLHKTYSYRAANMHIAEVCKEKRKTAYGYHWKYE